MEESMKVKATGKLKERVTAHCDTLCFAVRTSEPRAFLGHLKQALPLVSKGRFTIIPHVL